MKIIAIASLGAALFILVPCATRGQTTVDSQSSVRAGLKAAKAFDKDRNRRIDSNELAELNKAFAAEPTGPLAALDRNKNGRIDDAETSAANSAKTSSAKIRQLDKDRNNKIEGQEVDELRHQFSADPSGFLAALDRNHDSKLDDAEIRALNERLARQSVRTTKKSTSASRPAPNPAPQSDLGTGSASLRWDPPTRNADGTPLKNLSGYVIRYGRSPEAMTRQVAVDDPRATEHVVSKLGDGTWYFTVLAVTRNGTESSRGPVVSKTIGPDAPAK